MSDAKPSVLFFVPGLGVGGAERHAVALRSRLEARGYQCHLLAHGSKRSEIMLRAHGARDAIFLNLKGMSQLGGWLRVWRVFRRLDPDVVFAINQTPLIVAVIIRLFLGTRAKIACIFHTTKMQAFERRLAALFRLAGGFADAIVYVSENQRDAWTAHGVAPRHSEVIANGVELTNFPGDAHLAQEIRARCGASADELLLGLVAAFREEKNHLEFIEALADARARGCRAKALFVGAGATMRQTQERARALGVADHVAFLGEQADVAPFMTACDVGILCSTIESFPLTALEFLACGVPMICSNVGGVGEIIENGVNGLLYESGRVDRLVDCILDLASAERRAQMAANARKSVDALTLERMTDQYVALLSRLARPVASAGDRDPVFR